MIDEIGTVEECAAARTIAQRGVQLLATAHGNALDNVLRNPMLADLLGGVTTVTLGDEEAARRGRGGGGGGGGSRGGGRRGGGGGGGGQKTVLEREGPPTFDVCVEMLERGRWRVHSDVARAVDMLLAGEEVPGEMREHAPQGEGGGVTVRQFHGLVRQVRGEGGVPGLARPGGVKSRVASWGLWMCWCVLASTAVAAEY